VDAFKLVTDAPYRELRIVTTEATSDFEAIVSSLPEPAHVLVVSPETFFESPPAEVIGPHRKLMAMACNSTPTGLGEIAHFMGIMMKTDPIEQDTFAERFFEKIEQADYLRVVNPKHGTELVFEHDDDSYVWNQQAGGLAWGEQQIVPSGEISVLPIEIRSFHSDLKLRLSGTLALYGVPILHSGTRSFLRVDQKRLHAELATMHQSPIIANVEKGLITRLRPAGARGSALDALEAMLHTDSRYGIIWEIGFALNTALRLLPGNHAMNEVYGGANGCLHWGLGLTPYTQYHLDVISPGTLVLDDTGTRVHGSDA